MIFHQMKRHSRKLQVSSKEFLRLTAASTACSLRGNGDIETKMLSNLFPERAGARVRTAIAAILALGLGFVADRETNAAPAPMSHRILVVGDSLAAGAGIDLDEAFPALLQKEIEKRNWNFTVVNAGVSGDTSAGGLRRLDWLLRQRVDVLLLELGGNDGLRGIPPAATKTNLQAMIDRTREKYPQARVVILGMKMPPNMGAEYQAQFENIFPDLAKKNQAPLVPFLLEGVGGKPELNRPDRIHPTPEGHRILATNVWKVLEPLLDRMRAENKSL